MKIINESFRLSNNITLFGCTNIDMIMSTPILPTIISKMSIILDIEFKSAVMPVESPTVAKADIVSNNTFVVSSFGF